MSVNTYFNVVLRVLLLIGFSQHQVNASAQTETDNDIDWFDCPFPTRHSAKCGHFTIPLDWNNTDGPKGRLAVTKFNSDDDQAEKRGIMFVHRGPLLGPVDTWLEDRGQFLLNMLLDQGFDVVTFDLRGSTARWQGDQSGSNHEFFSIPAASQCLNVTARTELTRCYGRIPKKVNFDALRECRIKGCLSPEFNPDRSNFKYMGTAASVRDLVALSGHLQGPNTPVNFWGISHGSLIGSYLINMFPNRAGYIILDAPVNPETYIKRDSFLQWNDTIHNAKKSMQTFESECRADRCFLANRDADSEDILGYFYRTLGAIRRILMDTNAFGTITDKDPNSPVRDLLEIVLDKVSPEYDVDIEEEMMEIISTTIHYVEDSNEPITTAATFCGDRVDEDPESIVRARQFINEELPERSRYDPLLGVLRLPLQHFCHAWSERAVERYLGPWDRKPANGALILANTINPINDPSDATSLARMMDRDTVFVQQPGLGHAIDPLYNSDTLDKIRDYLSGEIIVNVGDVITAPSKSVLAGDLSLLLTHYISYVTYLDMITVVAVTLMVVAYYKLWKRSSPVSSDTISEVDSEADQKASTKLEPEAHP